MPFSHSFSPDFYGCVHESGPCDKPTNLADAIASIDKETWDDLAKTVFDCPGEFLTVETVYEKARETDTVTDLCTPIEVWIDSEGYYRVEVY
jgi:hypothetical protein